MDKMGKGKTDVDLDEVGKRVNSILSNISMPRLVDVTDDDLMYLDELRRSQEEERKRHEIIRSVEREKERKKEVRYWVFTVIITIISFLMGKYL